MKAWLWVFGVFAGGAYFIAMMLGTSGAGGFPWGMLIGVGVGLLLGATTHFLTACPWHWRVCVKTGRRGEAIVVLRRLTSEVKIAEIRGADEDFDDRLHEVVAEARRKAAAMEVASR